MVANELVVALTALATNVLVLKDNAYEAVVANELVVALTALATNVLVLNANAYEAVVAKVAVPVNAPTNNVAVTVPPTVKLLFIVVVPVLAPMVIVVADPAKFTVVATVLAIGIVVIPD